MDECGSNHDMFMSGKGCVSRLCGPGKEVSRGSGHSWILEPFNGQSSGAVLGVRKRLGRLVVANVIRQISESSGGCLLLRIESVECPRAQLTPLTCP